MIDFGFQTRDNNVENIAKFATLYFDSDAAGKSLGYPTPQKYLQYLNSIDPMIHVPDPAVFVARTSFLFRGLGALLQQQLHTSQHWKKHAKIAIDSNGEGLKLYNLGLTPSNNE
jgi:aarF domain-containing kinase